MTILLLHMRYFIPFTLHKTLIALLAVAATTCCYAQKKDTSYYNLNEKFAVTSKKNMKYQGKIYKVEDGYKLEVFYNEGYRVFESHYKDAKMKVEHGLFTYYFPGNQKQIEGKLENGQKVGVWKRWYPNGNLMDSGTMRGLIRDGQWYSWYPNGQLKEIAAFHSGQSVSTAANTGSSVFDGIYRTWYENGLPECEGSFASNARTGTWRWYHDNGRLSTIEMYNKSGKVDSMQCFDTTGTYQGDYCSLEKGAYLKGLGDFGTYFQEWFSWSPNALKQKKKGTVWVTVEISKEGKIGNLEVKGTTEVLAREVHKFIRSLPDWEPAVSHNRLVTWKETLEVHYEGRPKITTELNPKYLDAWRPDYINEAVYGAYWGEVF